jgi:hypothetical protein
MLKRLFQRLLIFGLGVFTVWLIVFVVFETADRRLPWMLAVGLTYGVAAYLILPRVIRMGLKVLQRRLVPSFNTDRPLGDARVIWVGAGTRDTGLSLTKLSFQITHATDSDANAERAFIVAELMKNQLIVDVTAVQSGQRLPAERVNHYLTDGEITVARLV